MNLHNDLVPVVVVVSVVLGLDVAELVMLVVKVEVSLVVALDVRRGRRCAAGGAAGGRGLPGALPEFSANDSAIS